jgi:hypothetical protein
MSVGTPEPRFGQAIQSPPAGSSADRKRGQALLQPRHPGGEEDDHVERPRGAGLDHGAARKLTEQRAKPLRRAREGEPVALMPSFLTSGVPE